MKDIKFERELKLLINYIREYGIHHAAIMKGDLPGSDSHNQFVIQVHRGYMLAQKSVLCNLTRVLQEKKQVKAKLKDANRSRDKEAGKDCTLQLEKLEFQEVIFRKIMDSIAWTLLRLDITDVRRLYGGEEPIDITDSNIESCVEYSELVFSRNPLEFALINDLTSFVQAGDILLYKYGESLSIIELKSGETNKRVLDLLGSYMECNCDRFLFLSLEKEDEKFKKQFERTVRQMEAESEVVHVLKTGQGTDRITGLQVNIGQERLELDTYTETLISLVEKARTKGYAIGAVEDCLFLGVYENDRFPRGVFSEWMRGIKHKSPIYDLRQSLLDPVAFPLFLQPFPTNTVVDIALGRVSVLLCVDLDAWLSPLEKEGFTIQWMSKKETNKLYAKVKGKTCHLSFDGRALMIQKDDFSFILQGGAFVRMFTLFNTPSAMRKYFMAGYDRRDIHQE